MALRVYVAGSMPLRPTTVRFDLRAATYVAQAAAELDVSVSQFIREASLIRAVLVMERAGYHLDLAEIVRWRELADRVAELSRVDNGEELGP